MDAGGLLVIGAVTIIGAMMIRDYVADDVIPQRRYRRASPAAREAYADTERYRKYQAYGVSNERELQEMYRKQLGDEEYFERNKRRRAKKRRGR